MSTTLDIPKILADHAEWASGKGGVKANLSGADLREANLSDARMSWQSHDMIGEVLWQAAEGTDQEMLASLIGRKTSWCWPEWVKFDHPAKEWALEVLRGRVMDGDEVPEVLREQAGASESEEVRS